jgi:hypothetical protein
MEGGVWYKPSGQPLPPWKKKIGTVPIKKDENDQEIIEKAKPIVANTFKQAPSLFEGSVVHNDGEDNTSAIFFTHKDVEHQWCPSCFAFHTRIKALEAELTEVKAELTEVKTKAILRQIALDIEKPLKIALLERKPTIKTTNLKTRKGLWRDDKVGQLFLSDLWDEATVEAQTEVLYLCGNQWTENMLLDVIEDDFQVLKKFYGKIAHPDETPAGDAISNEFRIKFLQEFGQLPHQELVEGLVRRFCS